MRTLKMNEGEGNKIHRKRKTRKIADETLTRDFVVGITYFFPNR